MIEPGSHNKHPETVDADEDDFVQEKKDDEKEDDDKKDDNDDYALVRNKVLGSLETRNEQMQTPIPSSSDKTL
ncbi:hypothetical protein Tco_0463401, partial [Tanacetum coccineum]